MPHIFRTEPTFQEDKYMTSMSMNLRSLVKRMEYKIISKIDLPVVARMLLAKVLFWFKDRMHEDSGEFSSFTNAVPSCLFLAVIISTCIADVIVEKRGSQ